MATKITGKVTSKSRAGTGIQIDGNKVWYNGTKEQLAAVAWKSTVTIEVDDQNKITEVSVLDASPAAVTGGNRSDNVQATIVVQAARNAAIALVDSLVKNDLAEIPTKKADKYGAYMALVESHTKKFFEETMHVFETGKLPEVDDDE